MAARARRRGERRAAIRPALRTTFRSVGVRFPLSIGSVIVSAREFLSRLPEGARVGLVAGDFFTDALPEADLFALGRIVHDWSVDKIRILLRKIHDRLPSGGALLIAERLLNADKTGPLRGQLQSLNMLVCTEGKERSAAEYRALLEEVGFKDVQARETGSVVDAVLALKA